MNKNQCRKFARFVASYVDGHALYQLIELHNCESIILQISDSSAIQSKRVGQMLTPIELASLRNISYSITKPGTHTKPRAAFLFCGNCGKPLHSGNHCDYSKCSYCGQKFKSVDLV